jgi:hypothetical protein
VGDGIARALEKVLEQWTGDERQRILDSLVRINIGTTVDESLGSWYKHHH